VQKCYVTVTSKPENLNRKLATILSYPCNPVLRHKLPKGLYHFL